MKAIFSDLSALTDWSRWHQAITWINLIKFGEVIWHHHGISNQKYGAFGRQNYDCNVFIHLQNACFLFTHKRIRQE